VDDAFLTWGLANQKLLRSTQAKTLSHERNGAIEIIRTGGYKKYENDYIEILRIM
jgi:hypothetical protein